MLFADGYSESRYQRDTWYLMGSAKVSRSLTDFFRAAKELPLLPQLISAWWWRAQEFKTAGRWYMKEALIELMMSLVSLVQDPRNSALFGRESLRCFCQPSPSAPQYNDDLIEIHLQEGENRDEHCLTLSISQRYSYSGSWQIPTLAKLAQLLLNHYLCNRSPVRPDPAEEAPSFLFASQVRRP